MADLYAPNEVRRALDVARRLALAGVPLFVAPPCTCPPGGRRGHVCQTGYHLPSKWQTLAPDPGATDRWQPGWALCAVMGHVVDAVDSDPRNGGDTSVAELRADGAWPRSYGHAVTPSGGSHDLIAPLRVGSRDAVRPGLDVKGGKPDGTSRGFVFIAPTVKPSKVTGRPAPYRWLVEPDLTGMRGDASGAALAELVRQGRKLGGGATAPGAAAFMAAPAWGTFDWGRALNGDVPPGEQQNTLYRAACSLRARGVADDLATATLRAVVQQFENADPSNPWETDHADHMWARVRREHPDGGRDEAEAWAALGVDVDRVPVAPAPGAAPAAPVGAPTRPAADYFGRDGLYAAKLADDILAGGPLAQGADDIVWSYHGGVWRPDKYAVQSRVVVLLADRYRHSHVTNAKDVVRERVPVITCEPVEQYINFSNGLLDWRQGALMPHTPDVLTTVQLPVRYEPAADCPAFHRFLSEVVPADMVPTVWELIGYLMYSGNPLHKAVMLTGTGRNGKGTLLRALTALLGRSNITSVSLHDLVNTRFSTASLFGKLANIAGDIDGSYLENTAVFKAITGGDQISAEHKGRDRFDFTPWAVPIFSANKIPPSADTTVGYLSRWLVVPFPNDFTGREDRTLDQQLSEPGELEGIAANAVRALPRLLARGDFELTESARAAQDEFARRVDQVRTWVADCCALDPAAPWVNRTALYGRYKSWAARDGHRPVRASEFYDRLESMPGVAASRRSDGRGFTGLRVVDTAVWSLPV